MNAISGLSSEKPSAFYDRESRSWRTWPGTAGSGSTESSVTVPKTGWMSGGYLYELPMSEHRTSESGCSSLLPTPTVNDAKNPDCPGTRNRRSPNLTAVSVHFPLLPTPRTTDSQGSGKHGDGGRDLRTTVASVEDWRYTDSDYWPAIHRWEDITQRIAPEPTEPNKNGKPRLTAGFDEWMMGLPKGWITDIDIPYGAKIKLCGNGVVPQQAELALRLLLDRERR